MRLKIDQGRKSTRAGSMTYMVLVQKGDVVFPFLPFFRDSPHAFVHYRESNTRTYVPPSFFLSFLTYPLPYRSYDPSSPTRRVASTPGYQTTGTSQLTVPQTAATTLGNTPDDEIANVLLLSRRAAGSLPHSTVAVFTPPQSCTSRISYCIPECAARATSPCHP